MMAAMGIQATAGRNYRRETGRIPFIPTSAELRGQRPNHVSAADITYIPCNAARLPISGRFVSN
jgi:hypothetical protein